MLTYIIRSYTILSLLGLLFSVFLVIPQKAYAGGIVTNCDDDTDLHAKLVGGGEVTFDCGPTPVTINLTLTDTLRTHINITQTTTISGGGLITLQGDGSNRIFLVDGSTLVIDGLTIRNGWAVDSSSPISSTTNAGGGLQIINNSVVTITASTLTNNRAGNVGGAVNVENSLLTVQDSTLFDNQADFGSAIYILNSFGRASIINSAIISNTATDKGGGIRTWESELTITDSTLANNRAIVTGSSNNPNPGSGAALAIYGSAVTISASTVISNQADFLGGAIYADSSDLTIQNSSLSDNQANFGGAIYNSKDFGFGGTATIVNSALINNTANGGDGGAIRIVDSQFTIANSTLSNNQAIGSEGSGGEGGAIGIVPFLSSNSILVTNTTIYSNFASIQGGGIQADSGYGSGSIKNSIVANNVAASAANCGGDTITSAGNNIDSGTSCNFSSSGDLSITDPLLGTLANNGGATLTHALLAGSPGINAADNAACAADPINNVDQRGVLRPQGAFCDIGAVEETSSLAIAKDSVNQGGEPIQPGERITYTVSVTNTSSLTATGGLISDTVPVNTTFVPGSIKLNPSSAGTEGVTPPTLASDLTIGAGQSVSVTYVVTVNSPLPNQTQIVNTASVTSSEVSLPQTSTVTDTVTSAPVLTIQKTSLDANGGALVPGDTISYTIVVSNSGTATATGGVISDTVPVNTTFVPGSIVLNPASAGTEGVTPPTLASDLTIGSDQGVSVTYAVTVNSPLPDQTQIVNTASLMSNEVSGPLTSTVTDTVANVVLSIKKTSLDANGGLLEPGDTLTYTILITNAGHLTATGGIISDSVPVHTSFVPGSLSLNPSGAGMKGTTPPTLASGLVITPNQTITLTYAVTINSSLPDQTIIKNTAAININELPGSIIGVVTNTVTSKQIVYLPVIQKNFVP
ncbi:MAG: DUF11 domain-containing protein [Anaerolineales bacterium]|nr:DUF11 domain-containing protein [Anaerolineales bacterium]